MNKKEKKLRDIIFRLNTRKFGDFNELLLERILQEKGILVEDSENASYDRIVDGYNDEIKGSRVWSKSKLDLKSENVIDSLFKHEDNLIVNIDESTFVKWDSNIQQIKSKYFKNLWYVLYFGDCIALFKIDHKQIGKDKKISYSNKQHRGNEGEGQFHITNKNIKYHLDTYLVKKFTYTEIYHKLEKKK
jgi:hypothetical protein